MELMGQMVNLDHKDLMDHLEIEVLLDFLDQMDHQ